MPARYTHSSSTLSAWAEYFRMIVCQHGLHSLHHGNRQGLYRNLQATGTLLEVGKPFTAPSTGATTSGTSRPAPPHGRPRRLLPRLLPPQMLSRDGRHHSPHQCKSQPMQEQRCRLMKQSSINLLAACVQKAEASIGHFKRRCLRRPGRKMWSILRALSGRSYRNRWVLPSNSSALRLGSGSAPVVEKSLSCPSVLRCLVPLLPRASNSSLS